MSWKTWSVDDVLPLLARIPEEIAAATAEVSPERLRASRSEGDWSANDVLAHLRSCADVWGDCMSRILAEEHPTIRAVNPRSWIERTGYREIEFHESLRAFTEQRAELLAVLRPLTPAQWSRSATLTRSGAPIDRTLFSFAARLARHEESHLEQLKRIVVAAGK